MEQAGNLFGDNAGTGQSLGSSITLCCISPFLNYPDMPQRMVQVLNMQQSLDQTPSSACCSPINPGRLALRADALALSAWLVQGLEGKCGLVLCCCRSALAAAWLEMPLRRGGIAACACFSRLASLTLLLPNLLELFLLSGMVICQTSRCPFAPGSCPLFQVSDFRLAAAFTAFAINGPPVQGGLPVFTWKRFNRTRHQGLPESYNFDFVTMRPIL